jgi:probable rRNA maturation factor
MTITIKNDQKKRALDLRVIKRLAQKIIVASGYRGFDFGVWFTTDKMIQKYNKKYRNKDCPTDILSFPFHQKDEELGYIVAKNRDEQNLGDVIISVEQIEKQAQELNQTFEERLTTLLIHGVCHLIGYTHDKEQEYDEMQKKEQVIRDQL